MEKEKLFQKALNNWGIDAQSLKLVEECSELINAICKHRLNRISFEDVAEEIADVEIMCEQLKYVFGEQLIERIKQEKLDRLSLILEQEG